MEEQLKGIDEAVAAGRLLKVTPIQSPLGSTRNASSPYLPDSDNAKHADSYKAKTQTDHDYPNQLAPEAFHGVLGEIVRIIEPHTEADPAGILIQALTAFGNVIGRKSHFLVESTLHFTNLFCVLVGNTSQGRKGTSWNHVRRIFSLADPDWAKNHILEGGLASGEGLIWAVRDPIEKTSPIREGGKIVDYQTEVVDHGVKDKRLLVIESEFASILGVQKRDGNTLSAHLRNAWDRGQLENRTKNNPCRATDAHISIIGHIVQDELLKLLSEADKRNGYGNRILWFIVKRSKSLPNGGNLNERDLTPLVAILQDAIRFGSEVIELKRSIEAQRIWENTYDCLNAERPGLFGAMTARGPAQVLRLSCLYALLDRSAVITDQHLNAALAVWEYAEASCKELFGGSMGNPAADQILAALQLAPEGLARAVISHTVFNKNKPSVEIDDALNLLRRYKLAESRIEETGGRPCEKWFLTKSDSALLTNKTTKAPLKPS